MSKQWQPKKDTVELRPSRIRREPVRPDKPMHLFRKAEWDSREWEVRLAIAGMVAFVIAINLLIFGIGVTYK